MRSLSVFLTSLLMISLLSADGAALASPYQAMKKGAESYQQGKYDESLSLFQQAQVESPDDTGIKFNLSSAEYQAGKFDEAARGFETVVSRSSDPKLRQKAFYNLGNTAFRQGNMQASADYYRKALDLDHSDLDAKQNLEFVLKAMENPEQKKNSQNQKDKDKGKDKNKEQQSSKPGQGKDRKDQNASSQKPEQNKDQQASSTQSQQDRGQKNEQGEIKEAGSAGEQKQGEKQKGAQAGKPLEPGSLAPEEAERLLNTLSDDQRAFLREQAKRGSPNARGTEKDW